MEAKAYNIKADGKELIFNVNLENRMYGKEMKNLLYYRNTNNILKNTSNNIIDAWNRINLFLIEFDCL